MRNSKSKFYKPIKSRTLECFLTFNKMFNLLNIHYTMSLFTLPYIHVKTIAKNISYTRNKTTRLCVVSTLPGIGDILAASVLFGRSPIAYFEVFVVEHRTTYVQFLHNLSERMLYSNTQIHALVVLRLLVSLRLILTVNIGTLNQLTARESLINHLETPLVKRRSGLIFLPYQALLKESD